MQINDVLHGFRVVHIEEVPEAKATLYRMEHVKNGADLIYCDRNDENKTFAITFKTIPHDDTGVFHILEHSVLCGSEKYPVKEPFVDLLKSSLNTFLNAFTFPDKTMYPVCSKNQKDFMNLMDVYLDAVLHPLSITDPHAYRQEGWHYELESPEGELTCNGVVYNEMKGAYASPDSVLENSMMQVLFPDVCYGCESGGHPDHIPELTYEDYLASHARFYHPSNSRIWLDGNMDLDAALAKIDSVIGEYDRIDPDADIPMQSPVSGSVTELYEIGPDEDPEGKAILSQGWVYGDFSEKDKTIACTILTEVLCGSNEAPLAKALLSEDLCEDVAFSVADGIQQNIINLVIRNAKEENIARIWEVVDSVMRDLAENGLDKKHLHSQLNHLEFVTKEKDFGGYPKGLVYAMGALDTWLYGGDPSVALCYDEVFRKLENGIDNGLFEEYLRILFIDNPHTGKVTLLPSATLGEEKREAERARLAEIKASWSSEEITDVMEKFAVLREKQNSEDSPEDKAKIPTITLADIPETDVDLKLDVTTEDGITVMHHPADTDGIDYLELYFALDDLTKEQLQDVSFFATLIGNLATENYSVLDLESEIDSNLGRFGMKTTIFTDACRRESCRPYIAACVSVLDNRKEEAVRLLNEILNKTLFTDKELIFNLIRQSRIGLEQNITMSGNRFAAMRALSCFSARAAAEEAINGISMLRWLQATEKAFENDADAVCAKFDSLKKLFSVDRLVVGLTSENVDRDWINRVAAVLGKEPKGSKAEIKPNEVRREGFTIAADIGFAAKAGVTDMYSGSARVASNIVSLDYLWDNVRVKGGAYGTSMSLRYEGDIALTSYRDPSPANTLATFDGAGEALRAFCDSDETVDKYIISTIAEPLVTPRAEGVVACTYYLSGRDIEERQTIRTQTLATTKEDLVRFSKEIEAATASGSVCVVGGKSVLEACGDNLEVIESIQQ